MILQKQKIGIFLFFSSALFLRILLGMKTGIWFPAAQRADDLLMVEYALFDAHFSGQNIYSLVKYIGFPIFLQAVFHSHLPYAVCIAFQWWFNGLLTFFVMRRLCRSHWLPYAFAAYLMFLPPAFESWCGTRLYRNACIGPFALTVLLLMVLIFLRLNEEKHKLDLFLSLLLGFLFLFTYYLKEDGAWLLACVVLWFSVGFLYAVFRRQKGPLLFFCIPFLVFLTGSIVYRCINDHFFGVFETNTRTGGEPGRFCEIIYQIDSSERTADVWAPYDAIQKAFAASDTLAKYPQLLQSIHDTPWFGGNIETQPITGDFLGWVLRSSLEECGLWENENQISTLFGNINDELEEALQNGSLPTQKGRVQLLPSAGSRSAKEVFSLRTLVKDAFAGAIFLKGYTPGVRKVSSEETDSNLVFVNVARELTNTPGLNTLDPDSASYTAILKTLELFFGLYRILNVVLFALSIFILTTGIIKALTNIRHIRQCLKIHFHFYIMALTAGLFLCIGIAYAFSIGWFSSFLFQDGTDMRILNFYNIALPGLLSLSYLFAAAAASNIAPLFHRQ